jgi:threonine/homoserine/homoserine lactone efflux protein
MVSDFAAFLGVAVVVIVTPGQDTALTIRNTLLGGRRVGILTALGVSTGQAVWTLAASAGIAALLAASEPAFLAVKLLGAAYLILLGARALRDACRRSDTSSHADLACPPERRLSPGAGLRQGVLSNLGNPKMAVFFTSLLPQFVSGPDGAFLPMLVLGLVFCALTFAWLTAYAFAVAKAHEFLHRPRIRRILDGLTGAFLVAFGVRLATEARS